MHGYGKHVWAVNGPDFVILLKVCFAGSFQIEAKQRIYIGVVLGAYNFVIHDRVRRPNSVRIMSVDDLAVLSSSAFYPCIGGSCKIDHIYELSTVLLSSLYCTR